MPHFSPALGVAFCALITVPAAAQYAGSGLAASALREAPADVLARHVRVLARSPRDFAALVGAGRAALATGDADAAVGFFGRAAEVWPSAPAPKAGLGAALAAMGDAARALPLFDQAQRGGASVISFAADRGLARDLLGQQTLAQEDYRLALAGTDAIEARRRLALSLAISGDRSGALTALAPLRPDPATNRTRAFVLALAGDADSVDRMLDASIPGMAARLDPFLRRLASLSPAQKAAAVHLGIMPGTGLGEQYSVAQVPVAVSPYAAAPRTSPAVPSPGLPASRVTYGPPASASGDRLSDIDALLKAGQPPAAQTAPSLPPQPAQQLASVSLPPSATPRPAVASAPRRFWVQLASGADATSLGVQFARIARRDPELFEGISPYVAEVEGRAKLLVGPFRSGDDSATFVENLNEARIDGFSWTSPEGQQVRKIAAP